LSLTLHETTDGTLQKVLTSSRKLDECMPLMQVQLSASASLSNMTRGRGSHSSSSQLNLRRFCHSKQPTYPTKSADVKPRSGGV
jgi:hypothetical protein